MPDPEPVPITWPISGTAELRAGAVFLSGCKWGERGLEVFGERGEDGFIKARMPLIGTTVELVEQSRDTVAVKFTDAAGTWWAWVLASHLLIAERS